jgi:protein ImuB
MCVHFPQWSLQRIWRQQPELRGRPLAITRPVANKGSKVVACCPAAARQGVRAGLVQAEALAILPSLTCVSEDLDADRQLLTEVAAWAQRYSPIVGLEETLAPTALFIDVTGCADCFGGEAVLFDKACDEFRADGWIVRIALADTIGAAWAQTLFSPLPCTQGRRAGGEGLLDSAQASAAPSPPTPLPRVRGRGERMLHDLPIAALRLSPPTVALLAQLGIDRVGQLAELPRDQVAERFGPEVGWRLDQAMGKVAEVIVPLHPQPEATASWAFDDPVERHEIVVKVLDLLLERLQAILEKRHCGARLVECILEQEDAGSQRFECSLSRPAQTASYLSGLMQTRLEQMRMTGPIRAMCVRAVVLERLPSDQPGLFDAGEASESALAQLLDSLASRLGRDAVTRARFVADPQPELACRFESALEASEPGVDDPRVFVHRPLRLFARPIPVEVVSQVRGGKIPILPMKELPASARSESCRHDIQRFHVAGVDHDVVRCLGPERIETGWWRGDDVQRDYFMVETTGGTRWWIFQRQGDGRWFLHGCFD